MRSTGELDVKGTRAGLALDLRGMQDAGAAAESRRGGAAAAVARRGGAAAAVARRGGETAAAEG